MITARFETQTDLLVQARVAYRGRDWEVSYAAFTRAGATGPLPLDDLDAMAETAWRLGYEREAVRVAELVYVRLTRTDPNAAAVKAVELGSAWLARGDLATGRSWVDRARGLLAAAPESPALGHLTYLEIVVAVLTGDADLLSRRSAALREVSSRVDVAGLTAVNLSALLAAGDDYALLAERLAAAARALESVHPAAGGEAYVQLGEVRRRRGDVEGAFAAFARARGLGVVPQPGEALLRAGRGDLEMAWGDVQAALAVADASQRVRLLRGAAEIAVARGDLGAAERHLAELAEAGVVDPRLRGALLVRSGRHREALTALRAALRQYRARRANYEAAEVHEWMFAAHHGLGADAAADADRAAAAEIYRRLGAQPARLHHRS